MLVHVFSLFLSFIEKDYQTEWNLHDDFSWTRRQPGDLEMKLEEPRGDHMDGGAPPPLCPPWLSWLNSFTYIFPNIPNHQREPRKHFAPAATFCTHEIPSRDLFRHLAGGGFDHGGLLQQLHCPSDEAWVVYLRPAGPYLVARWLVLSLWFSIPCSPRCSWRSIWCNLLLRCVCRDPMNCGFMISLSMNIIWIFFEFLYVWFDIFVILFELLV